MIHSKTLLGSWATPVNVALVLGMMIGFGTATALLTLFPSQEPGSDPEVPACALVSPDVSRSYTTHSRFTPWSVGPLTLAQRTPPPHAWHMSGGLTWVELQKPHTSRRYMSPHASVKVRMLGWDEQGVPLEGMNQLHVSPVALTLDAVIPGFAQTIQDMREGERRRVWIPPSLGYQNAKHVPPGTLIFDVELVSIMDTGAPLVER